MGTIANVEKILEKYKVNEKELPLIKKNDPSIKDLNAESGDLIEIKRNILTAKGDYLYYRRVI